MSGFTSQDNMINALSNLGQTYRTDWQKSTFATTAHTAGLWYSLFRGGGNPPADTILGTGTNLAFQALTDATTNAAGIPHGGNVGDYKVLLNAAAQTAGATTAPCVLMLVDLLGFYPVTTVTTTGAQTLNNTVTLPRYTTGAGVQAFITPSTVMGAATPNITLGYTIPIKPSQYLSKLRVYVTAQQLATFTKYPGMNPEIAMNEDMGWNGLGVDRTTYPVPRTFSIGCNISF